MAPARAMGPPKPSAPRRRKYNATCPGVGCSSASLPTVVVTDAIVTRYQFAGRGPAAPDSSQLPVDHLRLRSLQERHIGLRPSLLDLRLDGHRLVARVRLL